MVIFNYGVYLTFFSCFFILVTFSSFSFLTWKTKQFYSTFLLLRSIVFHILPFFFLFLAFLILAGPLCVLFSPKCWYSVSQNSLAFSLAADPVWFSLHALVSELLLQHICLGVGVSCWPEPWGRSTCTFPKIKLPKISKGLSISKLRSLENTNWNKTILLAVKIHLF